VALAEMLELVGLAALTQPDEGAEADQQAQELMQEREKARAAKDFARADELRDQLAEMGWTVRDSAGGPSLVPKA
jgi:cysteinyl-tRNA synthetase